MPPGEEDLSYQDLTIPATLGEPEDTEFDDDDGGDEGDDLDVSQIKADLEALKSSSSEDREFYQQSLMQLAGSLRPQQAAQQQDGGAESLTLDDLPDPVENRAEFNKELTKRVGQITDNKVQQVQSQQTTQTLENDLYNRFSRDYDDLMDREALFQAAVTQEINTMRAGGQSPVDIIRSNPKRFVDKVATRMVSDLGYEGIEDFREAADDEGQGAEPQPQKRSRARRARSEPAKNTRTRQMSRSSRGEKGKRKRGEEKVVSFQNAMREAQAADGLI